MTENNLFVDPNKQKLFISLGIPMYNELEKGHLHETIDNALAVGFDDIVILDDGSTDDSWIILQEYAKRFPHIRVFRNDDNSVFSLGDNRWKFIVDRIAEKTPDWVVIRAADQIYSYKATVAGGDHFRKRLTELYYEGVEIVRLPLAHFWRSRTWYRVDDVWGKDINTHSKSPIWRYHPDYNYDTRLKTGTHMGWHHPSDFGFGKNRKKIVKDINIGPKKTWDLVILHLGHTTHNKKVLKFQWSMKAATANAKEGRSILMPPPDKMPPIKSWLKFNGYKGFFEFGMKLVKAPENWFAGKIDYSKKPIPRSLYYIILEYNRIRAEEYLTMFNKAYPVVKKVKSKRIRNNKNIPIDNYVGQDKNFNEQKKELLIKKKAQAFRDLDIKHEGEIS